MKLHLGCGQRYLEGYLNIDFPLNEHTAQKKSVADQTADILTLQYEPDSLEEIRLHHVFEHFSRPVACALLTTWYFWLKPGGILHLEVPDFKKSAQIILSPFKSEKAKKVAERHVFGSQEAPWAVHQAGYTPKGLTDFLSLFGFNIKAIKKNNYCGTYNFEILAVKNSNQLDREKLSELTKLYLSQFLLPNEINKLDIWLEQYQNQVNKFNL